MDVLLMIRKMAVVDSITKLIFNGGSNFDGFGTGGNDEHIPF